MSQIIDVNLLKLVLIHIFYVDIKMIIIYNSILSQFKCLQILNSHFQKVYQNCKTY